MIAMNAETYNDDLAEVRPGGFLLYDSTWPRKDLNTRDDITVLGVPLSGMCNEKFDSARAKVLMKNVAYVGAIWGSSEFEQKKRRPKPPFWSGVLR